MSRKSSRRSFGKNSSFNKVFEALKKIPEFNRYLTLVQDRIRHIQIGKVEMYAREETFQNSTQTVVVPYSRVNFSSVVPGCGEIRLKSIEERYLKPDFINGIALNELCDSNEISKILVDIFQKKKCPTYNCSIDNLIEYVDETIRSFFANYNSTEWKHIVLETEMRLLKEWAEISKSEDHLDSKGRFFDQHAINDIVSTLKKFNVEESVMKAAFDAYFVSTILDQ